MDLSSLPAGQIRQIRMTCAANLLLVLAILPFLILYTSSRRFDLGTLMLLTIVAGGANLLALRYHDKPALAANLTVAILFLSLTIPGLFLDAPNELWIYLVPLTGLLLAGPFAGWIWIGWVALVIVTLPAALIEITPLGLPADPYLLHRLVSVLGIGVLTTCLLSVQHQTERMLGEEICHRRRAEQRALDSSREKNELLASVSHELRTPMHGILGLTDILSQDELTTSQRSRVELIGSSAEALLALVEDLVDLAKIEAGELSLQTLDFDLRLLLDRSLELVSPRIGAKSLQIHAEVEPKVPQKLHGDPARLRQVLLNLLANAIRFTNEGRVDVFVRLEAGEAAEGDDNSGKILLRFAVQDTGIGISGQDPAMLFAPFFTSDRSGSGITTARAEGIGLGLAICKRLVEHMGGEISCRGLADGGSLFWFTLPFHPASPDGEPKSSTERGTSRQLRPLEVLVVDDSSLARQVVEEQLSTLGHHPTTAESGERALALLAERSFDLLLIDVRMPGIDGFETVRRYLDMRRSETPREAPPTDRESDMVIVAMTGLSQNRSNDEYWLHRGMRDRLIKPVRLDDLESTLQRWFSPEAPNARPSTGETSAGQQSPGKQSPGKHSKDRPASVSTGKLRQKIVREYLIEGPRYLQDMRRASSCGDRRALSEAAHALGGISVYVRARHLVESCEALEAEAPRAPSPELDDLVDLIAEELELILTRLRFETASP